MITTKNINVPIYLCPDRDKYLNINSLNIKISGHDRDIENISTWFTGSYRLKIGTHFVPISGHFLSRFSTCKYLLISVLKKYCPDRVPILQRLICWLSISYMKPCIKKSGHFFFF